MNNRIFLFTLLSTLFFLSNAEARTYSRSCTGGIWVSYYSDAYHYHTIGWLNDETARATARYHRYQPNTLRGRARDRLKNDCFQNLNCSGEMNVGGKMVNMTRPWPYSTNYDAIADQIERFVCNDARLNFRDVRSIRAQLRITGDVNCGLSNRKNFYADFLSQGNPSSSSVICSGRHPR